MVAREYLKAIIREHLSPLSGFFEDPCVTEIMINPGGRVFVEAAGEMRQLDITFAENTVFQCIKAMAKLAGRSARPGSESAILHATFDDMRIAAALFPVCPDGSFVTIRKHGAAGMRSDLDALVGLGALSPGEAELLVDLVVRQRRNCLFSGGTGSGKTTLINALLARIPAHERIICVEDARELEVVQPNAFCMLTNPEQGITARLAVKTLLRHRPDRIILGETRGDETYDLIRALNSGHPGSMSSIHANSATDALDTLQMLYQQSLPPNASLPAAEVMKFIARAVHVVVHVHREIRMVGNRALVSRGVSEIRLVKGVNNGYYQTECIGEDIPAVWH